DITERKVTEARLRESELRLRENEALFSTAFHASPLLMTIATLPDAKFVEVNDAFIRTIGLERSETIGRNTAELGVWGSLEERAQFFDAFGRTGTLRNIECRLRSSDGSEHTMLLSADVIEINRQPHLLTFGLDITQRKKAEAEQQKALDRERELSHLK